MKVTPNQLAVPQFGARRSSTGDNVPLFIALGIGALAAGAYYLSTRTDVFQRRQINQLSGQRQYADAGGYAPPLPRQKPATLIEKPQLSTTFMQQLREFFDEQKAALLGAPEQEGADTEAPAPDKSADEACQGKGPATDDEGPNDTPNSGEKA